VCRCLPADLAAVATVTTTEPKYAASRHVAEWWCTLTSPAFALGLVVYLQFPLAQISLQVRPGHRWHFDGKSQRCQHDYGVNS
jgi:hypothetical protein